MHSVIIIGGNNSIGREIIELLLPQNEIINISTDSPDIVHENFTHIFCDITKEKLPTIKKADVLIYCPNSSKIKPLSSIELEGFKESSKSNNGKVKEIISTYTPVLQQSTNGSIMIFNNVTAQLGLSFQASMAVAKSSINNLIDSLDSKLKSHIPINAIALRLIDTNLASKIISSNKEIRDITFGNPLKKFLTPEEVASITVFMLSQNGPSVTGEIFEMDCSLISLND